MRIVDTYRVADPENTAYRFGIVLAGDYGYENRVEPDGADWLCIAQDGRAVRFQHVSESEVRV